MPILARGCDCRVRQTQNRKRLPICRFRLFERDPPTRAFPVSAPHPDLPTDVDQVVAHRECIESRSDLVDRISGRNAVEIDSDGRIELAKRRQLHARLKSRTIHRLPEPRDLRFAWELRTDTLLRAETPSLYERRHGDVERASGAIAHLECSVDHVHEGWRSVDPFGRASRIEARNLGVLPI